MEFTPDPANRGEFVAEPGAFPAGSQRIVVDLIVSPGAKVGFPAPVLGATSYGPIEILDGAILGFFRVGRAEMP